MTMLRVRVGYSGIGGTPYLTTYYFGGSGSTMATACGSAVAAHHTALKALQDSGITYRLDPQVVEMDESTGSATASYSITAATAAGALSVESLPFASQGLVRLRTGDYANGREIRGRHFIPGLTENANNDGAVVSTTVTSINAIYASLIGDGATDWVVWSRFNGSVNSVTTADMWEQFATLRTRRPGF